MIEQPQTSPVQCGASTRSGIKTTLTVPSHLLLLMMLLLLLTRNPINQAGQKLLSIVGRRRWLGRQDRNRSSSSSSFALGTTPCPVMVSSAVYFKSAIQPEIQTNKPVHVGQRITPGEREKDTGGGQRKAGRQALDLCPKPHINYQHIHTRFQLDCNVCSAPTFIAGASLPHFAHLQQTLITFYTTIRPGRLTAALVLCFMSHPTDVNDQGLLSYYRIQEIPHRATCRATLFMSSSSSQMNAFRGHGSVRARSPGSAPSIQPAAVPSLNLFGLTQLCRLFTI